MKLPEYIKKEEVVKVCKELKIRDWTKLKEAKVRPKEAKTLLALVNTQKMHIDPEQFRLGLEVELEHGVRFKDANVTNNHPLVTGMIVGYDRAALSFQPTDVITARDFRVTLTAAVTVLERSTGRTNLHREVTGHTTIRFGTDQTSAERQALPLLAEDLARNITSLLVDGTW